MIFTKHIGYLFTVRYLNGLRLMILRGRLKGNNALYEKKGFVPAKEPTPFLLEQNGTKIHKTKNITRGSRKNWLLFR